MTKTYLAGAQIVRAGMDAAAAVLTDEQAAAVAAIFPLWSGNGVSYAAGDRVQYETLLYKCLQSHTSQTDWTPPSAVSLWARIDDPAVEWPEWRQPAGAHDAYAMGAKVSHNDKHWISTVDANVWEPGVSGWSQVDGDAG